MGCLHRVLSTVQMAVFLSMNDFVLFVKGQHLAFFWSGSQYKFVWGDDGIGEQVQASVLSDC